MEMIKTVDLHKSFGELHVLKGVSQTIEKGEVVSVIGPSGGGKSTFLRCLNLLEKPESGKIRRVTADDIKERASQTSPAPISLPRSTSTSTGRKWAWCSSISMSSLI